MDSPVAAKAALLLALIEGDSFALELIQRVSERTSGRIRLHQGSVYPALRSLEQDGLIRGRWGKPLPQRGGRPRRYYQLTASGVRAAKTQREVILSLVGQDLLEAPA